MPFTVISIILINFHFYVFEMFDENHDTFTLHLIKLNFYQTFRFFEENFVFDQNFDF